MAAAELHVMPSAAADAAADAAGEAMLVDALQPDAGSPPPSLPAGDAPTEAAEAAAALAAAVFESFYDPDTLLATRVVASAFARALREAAQSDLLQTAAVALPAAPLQAGGPAPLQAEAPAPLRARASSNGISAAVSAAMAAQRRPRSSGGSAACAPRRNGKALAGEVGDEVRRDSCCESCLNRCGEGGGGLIGSS